MSEIAKDLVILLQSRVRPISLRFLGVGRDALFTLRPAIFEQLYSYANH